MISSCFDFLVIADAGPTLPSPVLRLDHFVRVSCQLLQQVIGSLGRMDIFNKGEWAYSCMFCVWQASTTVIMSPSIL